MDKLKNWLNFNSPDSATWEEWREFNREFKNKAPVRYWFSKQFLPSFRNRYRRITDLGYELRYRTIDKYHVVNTKLKPGYYDADTRMLHAMMSLLVDYVEIELATCDLHCDQSATWKERFIAKHNPNWRNAKRGIRYLNENSDELTNKKALSIYQWWTLEYPKYERMQSELLDHNQDESLDNYELLFIASDDPEIEARYQSHQTSKKAMYDALHALEDTQRKTTQSMLHKLIDIRESLWT